MLYEMIEIGDYCMPRKCPYAICICINKKHCSYAKCIQTTRASHPAYSKLPMLGDFWINNSMC